jgi:hypothetical protein
MSDHEQLHERREHEADALERENERLGEHVEEARKANAALESDELIATPAAHEGEQPPPEAQYTDKGDEPAKDD